MVIGTVDHPPTYGYADSALSDRGTAGTLPLLQRKTRSLSWPTCID
jgi:hypothetical protein